MPSPSPFDTLETWTRTDDRRAALAQLAKRLSAPWRAGRTHVGRCGLGELVNGALGQGFLVVPGGWLRMGFSVDDVFVAATARGDGAPVSPWGNMVDRSRPTRWVRIRPFLLAITGLPPEGASGATDGGRAAEAYHAAVQEIRGANGDGDADDPPEADDDAAADAAEPDPPMRRIDPEEADELVPDGFRLPSEAELEWAFREGGATRWIGLAPDQALTAGNRWERIGALDNGFGLRGVANAQNLCADGSAGAYDGASPIDQAPRNTAARPRIARWGHTYWQDDDAEMIALHAANRAVPDEYGDTILRLAADLPPADESAAAGDPPGPLAEHALALAALLGDDPRRRADALAALGHLAAGSGADADDTVRAVVDRLADAPLDTRAALLTWLADVQVGGHFDATVLPPERRRRDALASDRAGVRAAVTAAAPAIARYLDDGDPDVRAAAALALAFCPDAPPAAIDALRVRLGAEDDPGVRAGVVLAYARLADDVRDHARDPRDAAARAIGTAFDGAPDLDGLVAATELERVPHLAFARGFLGNVAVSILDKLGGLARARGALALAVRAARTGDAQLACFAAGMAFGTLQPPAVPDAIAGADGRTSRPAYRPWTLDELSPTQRAVLTALLDVASVPFHAHGLPATPNGRRRLLGIDPPGPSDRAVAYAGATRPLWFALRELQRRATLGDDVAAELDPLIAELDPTGRLTVFLDRAAHGLGMNVQGPARWAPALPPWKLDDLLAAIVDRAAARAAIDALRPHLHPAGRIELVRALAALRDPGEPLDPALLDDVDDQSLGGLGPLAEAFPADALARRLEGVLRVHLDRALATDNWQIGLDQQLTRWAVLLAVAPSPRAARALLVLGWSSGQPAAVRTAVGEAAARAGALTDVLADYDAQPQFANWPAARAGLAELLRRDA